MLYNHYGKWKCYKWLNKLNTWISTDSTHSSQTVTLLKLTVAPLLWGWGWCIADCCTSPHIRTVWTERFCPPEHDGCRRRIRSICAACRVWGCRSTAAYYPPLRNGCVYLRTSRDSGPWEHQLIGDRRESTLHHMNDICQTHHIYSQVTNASRILHEAYKCT